MGKKEISSTSGNTKATYDESAVESMKKHHGVDLKKALRQYLDAEEKREK